jgi:hypothetical protein
MKIHTSIAGALAPKKIFVASALVLSLTVGGITSNIIKNTFALEGDDDGDTPVITTDDPEIKRSGSSLRDELPERIYLMTNISPRLSIAGSSVDLGEMIPLFSSLSGQKSINFDDYYLDYLDIEDETIVKLDDDGGYYDYGRLMAMKPGRTTIVAERDGERAYIQVIVGKMTNSPIMLGRTGKDLEFEVNVEGFSSSLLRFETQGVMGAAEDANGATLVRNGNKFTLKTPAIIGNKLMNNLYLAPIAIVVDDNIVGAVMAISVPLDLIKVTDNIGLSPENEAKIREILGTVAGDAIDFLNLLAASNNVEQDFFDTILDKLYDLKLKPLFENGELVGIKDFDLALKDGTVLHVSSTEIIQQIRDIIEEENSLKKGTKKLNSNTRQVSSGYYEEDDEEDNAIAEIFNAINFNLDATDGTDDSLASALPKGTKGIKTKVVDSGLNLTLEDYTIRVASISRLGEALEYTFDASDAEPETNLKRRWFVAYYDNGEKKVTEATYDANTKTIKFSANATGSFTYGYIDGYTAPLVPNTGSISSNAAKTAIITFVPVIALAIAAFAVRTKKKQDKKLAKNLKNWN